MEQNINELYSNDMSLPAEKPKKTEKSTSQMWYYTTQTSNKMHK